MMTRVEKPGKVGFARKGLEKDEERKYAIRCLERTIQAKRASFQLRRGSQAEGEGLQSQKAEGRQKSSKNQKQDLSGRVVKKEDI